MGLHFMLVTTPIIAMKDPPADQDYHEYDCNYKQDAQDRADDNCDELICGQGAHIQQMSGGCANGGRWQTPASTATLEQLNLTMLKPPTQVSATMSPVSMVGSSRHIGPICCSGYMQSLQTGAPLRHTAHISG